MSDTIKPNDEQSNDEISDDQLESVSGGIIDTDDSGVTIPGWPGPLTTFPTKPILPDGN